MKKILILVLLFSLSNVLYSQIFVFQPNALNGKDAYVSSFTDSINYGDDPYMFFGGGSWDNDTLNLYIKFDLSSVPVSTPIASARIDLDYKGYNGMLMGGYKVIKVTQPWKEDSLYWYNQPSCDTNSLYSFSSDDYGMLNVQGWNHKGWRSIFLPDSIVQSWVDNPGTNYGVMIKTTGGFYGYPLIPSSDWGDSTFHPRIILNSSGSKIAGIVTDSVTGNPLSGIVIAAYNLDGTLKFAEDTTNASGNYSLEVLYPETFQMLANGITGYMSKKVDSLTVQEGQTVNQNILMIPNAHAIAGTASGIWSVANSPYIISGDIVVEDSTILTIHPGVEIKYSGPFQIAVYGCLKAAGTETDSIFFTSHDTVTLHKGRGVRFYEADSSILEYCRIENMRSYDQDWGQTSYDCGGGIYSNSSDLTIQHCLIRKNFAQSGGGMFILSYNDHICNINRNRIEENISYYNGCSNDGGGGVCINAASNYVPVFFDDNLILNNKFIDAYCTNHEGGGGMLVLGGNFNIINNNFLYNTAKRGPAIYLPYFDGKILNNIFWFNHDGVNHEQVALEEGNMGAGFEVSYNCIQDTGVIYQDDNIPLNDTVPGIGNIYTYPEFADTIAGHYWPNPNSLCIDNASNKMLRTQYDFFNRCRVFDGDYNGTGIVDMGAYEYNANSYSFLDIGPDKSICFDSANSISVNPYYEHYYWSTGDTLNYTQVISSDTFYITVNNTLGCYAFDSISVIVNPLPVVYLENDTSLCYGNTINIEADAGYASYVWNDTITGGSSILTDFDGGDYFVYVTDQNQCSNYSDTLHVAIYPLPVVDLGNDTTIYHDGSVYLDAGPGFTSYAWSTGDITQQCTITGSYLGLGSSYVYATVTDGNGCEGVDDLIINVISGAGINNYNLQDVSIYPNPAETFSTILVSFPNSQSNLNQVKVYNSLGCLVINRILRDENFMFTLSEPGLYIIAVSNDSKIEYYKLTVK